MRAALIEALGSPAVVGDKADLMDTAEDMTPIDVLAAALNPLDLAVASGSFYAGHPPPPYVPAIECVGRTGDGRLVYASGAGLGVSRDGACAERCLAPSDGLIELPESIDPCLAAALGTAGVAGWQATRARGQAGAGETVAVLGVTGSAGRIAAQAARAAGAATVVGLGRDASRLGELTGICDMTFTLNEPDLASRLTSATGGINLLVDFVWGDALESVLPAVAIDGRVVHVGAAGAPALSLASALVRGKRISLLGYSNFGLTAPQFRASYQELIDSARIGTLTLPVISVPLEEIGRAWAGLRNGAGKYVVTVAQ